VADTNLQGLEDGKKGVTAEIPKPRAVTAKRADFTTLDFYTVVVCSHQLNNTTSNDQPLLKMRRSGEPLCFAICLSLFPHFLSFLFIFFYSFF